MKLIKHIFLTFLTTVLICFFLVSFALKVEAHVLQVDGTIGAVLHIDPDDDPIANAPATFFFDFKDTQNLFQIPDCDCNVSILSAGKPIFSEKVNNNPDIKTASTSISFSSVFPAKGIYTVIADGTPLPGKNFQQFKLSYDIRVDRVATGSTQPNWFTQLLGEHFLHIIIFGVAIVIGIYLTIKGDRKEKGIAAKSDTKPDSK